jgi:hypothetical protein
MSIDMSIKLQDMLELLGSWTLSDVRYFKKLKNSSVPETGSLSVLRWDTYTLFGPLDKGNFNHWIEVEDWG